MEKKSELQDILKKKIWILTFLAETPNLHLASLNLFRNCDFFQKKVYILQLLFPWILSLRLAILFFLFLPQNKKN